MSDILNIVGRALTQTGMFFIQRFQRSTSFLTALFKKYFTDQCLIRAAGLSYSSLLALVPLAAVFFSLLTAFGALEDYRNTIQEFLFSQLVPTSSEDIIEGINIFLQNSSSLGVVGILFFTLTSVFMLENISNNFNAIWGSSRGSNFFKNFTTYLSVLVIGTLFISASFSITPIFLRALGLENQEELTFIIRFLTRFFPSFFIFLAFFFMIMLIPVGRVEIPAALIGALSGAIIWEVAKFWFLNIAGNILRMSVIYGTLAVIPIFLFWLYLAWLIVLLALEISWIVQFKAPRREYRHIHALSSNIKIQIILELLTLIIQSHYDADHRNVRIRHLSQKFRITEQEMRELLRPLLKGGIITTSTSGYYLPAQSVESIPLAQIFKLITGGGLKNRHPVFERFVTSGIEGLENRTLKDLLNPEALMPESAQEDPDD
jgi:membrane protein